MSTATAAGIGHVTQVIGSTFDAEFAEDHLPEIYNAAQDRYRGQGRARSTSPARCSSTWAAVRSAAWRWVDRRPGPRHGCPRHRRAGHRAGRQGDARPRVQPAGRSDRQPRAGHRRGTLADPPRAAASLPTSRPRPKSSRPASRSSTCSTPFVRGGKAGLFGGAGLGKTVILNELIARIASAARRLFGVRRRRRTHPRRQRPVAGNAGSQDRQHRPARHRSDRRWSSAR